MWSASCRSASAKVGYMCSYVYRPARHITQPNLERRRTSRFTASEIARPKPYWLRCATDRAFSAPP